MQKKLGALWRHQMKDGKTYFTGSIEFVPGLKTNIVCFVAEQKNPIKGKSYPAYNIFISEPKQQGAKEEKIEKQTSAD